MKEYEKKSKLELWHFKLEKKIVDKEDIFLCAKFRVFDCSRGKTETDGDIALIFTGYSFSEDIVILKLN